MWIVLLVFVGVPLAYLGTYGMTFSQAVLYSVTLTSLLLGYFTVRSVCKTSPILLLRRNPLPREDALKKVTVAMLAIMLVTAALAVNAMRELGGDYRLLFFVEQKDIFGYERFGFFMQIFTEYGAIPLFALALTLGRNHRWKLYLLAWAVLGTTITLGRWYAFYAVLLFVLAGNANQTNKPKAWVIFYGFGAVADALGAALLFACRGDECAVSGELLLHGLTEGVANYLYVPIEMVDAYWQSQEFGAGLLIGFVAYPFELLGRLTGLYSFVYEYDKWGLLIQEYITLPNIGRYNALVGQPLTSFVALGLPGVVIHYLTLGGLIGVSYYNATIRHPLATTSAVIAVTSFFIPSLSGPMGICILVFFAVLLFVVNCLARRPASSVG